MKRIMLTGTGEKGFVGRNLKESFKLPPYKEKYDVFATTSKEVDLRDHVAVEKYIRENRIESVILSASDGALDAHLRMFFNVERLAGKLDKVIYFGSGAEYDKRHDIVMATEDDIGKRIPADEYGFAKYIMTQQARKSGNIYCLRLFGIFGKYEDWTYKFISNLCCKAVYGLPFTIRRECAFDYIHVEDMPPVIDWILENEPTYKDYNFVSGRPVLLTQIAEMVLNVSGKDLGVEILNPNGRNNEYTASNARLNGECPQFAVTHIEKAIGKLYRYYYDNKDMIDLDTLRETR
jgi:GDP-L-fucose synthase